MKFKIVANVRGQRDDSIIEFFELQSTVAASRFHGDFWNIHFASSDRYRSTMYLLNNLSRRWQKAEVINW